jgi:hypothetical protein
MHSKLKTNIDEMFDDFGLKMVSDGDSSKGPILPNAITITTSNFTDHKIFNIEQIKDFIYSKNHFIISDRDFFLSHLLTNLDSNDSSILYSIFDSVRFSYIDDLLDLSFYNLSSKLFLNLSQSKIFMEQFTKSEQVKYIFSNDEKIINQIECNVAYLILNKINGLDIKNKLDVDLPKLILENLS